MSRLRHHNAHITVDTLNVTYHTRSGSVTALHNLSCSIDTGEFVAIIGPNGCGKSTLLRAVGGLITPQAGSIRVGGVTPHQARKARVMGFMFQQPVLFPWYTTWQNIELPLRLFGWRRQARHRATAQVLELVGLADFARAYPHELSGGMRQRVAIARAIVFDPAVLLMDEPFSALDELTREQLNIELLRIWSEIRATVLFVTHAISEAVFLADRVLLFSPAPARVVASLVIDLPRPRSPALLESEPFLHCVAEVRRQFRSGSV